MVGGGKSAGRVLKQVRVSTWRCERAQSVLVVGLLLTRAGDAVLRLSGAGAQAVQSPTILSVVDVVLEEKLRKTKHRNFSSITTQKLSENSNRVSFL